MRNRPSSHSFASRALRHRTCRDPVRAHPRRQVGLSPPALAGEGYGPLELGYEQLIEDKPRREAFFSPCKHRGVGSEPITGFPKRSEGDSTS